MAGRANPGESRVLTYRSWGPDTPYSGRPESMPRAGASVARATGAFSVCRDSDGCGLCEWAPATQDFLPVTLTPDLRRAA